MFDVFCSYNTQDRPAVLQVASELNNRGLRVWIDVWEIELGKPVQDALETIVETTGSAAVFVGPNGEGPWQALEIRVLLSQYVKRRLPVIPVLLAGAKTKPDLPLFLREFPWLDLNEDFSKGIDRLEQCMSGSRRNVSRNVSIAHDLPRPNPTYVQRKTYFDQVLAALDPNHKVWGAAIDGVSGVGKTSLAASVAHHCFDEGIFERIIWTSANTDEFQFSLQHRLPEGRIPLVNDNLFDAILHAFGEHGCSEEPREVKRRQAHETLKSSNCLLVLDNLETLDSIEETTQFVARTTDRTKTIITSQTPLLDHRERRVHLSPMNRAEVGELINQLSSMDTLEIDDSEVNRLYELVGGIPLAIEWCVHRLRSGVEGAAEFLSHLEAVSKTGDLAESDLRFLKFCFQAQHDSLNDALKRVLYIIGMISQPMAIDEIADVADVDFRVASDAVSDLLARSLVVPFPAQNSRGNRYTLLPLTRLFVRSVLARSTSLKAEILGRYASFRERLSERNTVCAFTPGYRPITLPRGATVRDFAYGVHTELGHRFMGAFVGDRNVGSEHEVHSGDIVQVTAGDQEPTEDCLAMVHSDQAKRAIRYYLKKPERSMNAVRRGNALALGCDTESCVQEFNTALQLDPNNVWCCNRLGQQVRLNGDLGHARQLHGRALSYEKNDPYAVAGLAAVEYQSGNVSEAGKLFEKALSLDSCYVNAAFGLARCQCASGDNANPGLTSWGDRI